MQSRSKEAPGTLRRALDPRGDGTSVSSQQQSVYTTPQPTRVTSFARPTRTTACCTTSTGERCERTETQVQHAEAESASSKRPPDRQPSQSTTATNPSHATSRAGTSRIGWAVPRSIRRYGVYRPPDSSRPSGSDSRRASCSEWTDRDTQRPVPMVEQPEALAEELGSGIARLG
jgi:hypothetical protein